MEGDRHTLAEGIDGQLLAAPPPRAPAAASAALERQRCELRRERDRVVLGLAQELGPERLAELFGVREAAIEKLIEGAQGRTQEAAPGAAPSARLAGPGTRAPRRILPGRPPRFTRSPDRWAEADDHYEALGRDDPDAPDMGARLIH
jgi:hypothetical protein